MIKEAIQFITNSPSFWLSMGWLSACGVLIGALLYNGDLKMLTKGIVTIGVYVMFLYFVSLARINTVSYMMDESAYPYTAYAGIVTVSFVTAFYIFGMIIGVIALNLRKKFKKSV